VLFTKCEANEKEADCGELPVDQRLNSERIEGEAEAEEQRTSEGPIEEGRR
jgi:hypothetical protein